MKFLFRHFLLLSTACILISGCEKYTYTPLYPTPPSSYYETIRAGTVYNGNLIVAGTFSHLFNATGIAQWNGTSWQSMGSGITGKYGPLIYSLITYNGNLIVAGDFSSAGGVPVNNIAQWNGSNWQALGAGITKGGYNGIAMLSAMVLYNGNLVVAGQFSKAGGASNYNIAEWNGTSWQGFGGGTDSGSYGSTSVSALAVYNGNLVVGGQFQSIGGTNVNCLAQWNGTVWSGVGSKCQGDIFSLFVYNGNLIAAGGFDTIGGIAAKGLAQWNGTSWSPLNQLASPIYGYAPNSPIVYNGTLYFNYAFDSTLYQWNGSGTPSIAGKASSTKERWNDPNVSPFINGLCIYNGNLIAGGWFNSVNRVRTDSNLVQWNGSTWLHL